jgi:hypothetical protein
LDFSDHFCALAQKPLNRVLIAFVCHPASISRLDVRFIITYGALATQCRLSAPNVIADEINTAMSARFSSKHEGATSVQIGDRVRKKSGSSWQGRIVGSYSTKLTPIGWAVESEREPGSVQIYPEAALEPVPDTSALER